MKLIGESREFWLRRKELKRQKEWFSWKRYSEKKSFRIKGEETFRDIY